MSALLKNLLRFGVSCVSLWLAFRGADARSVGAALGTVSPWAIGLGISYVLLTFAPATLRLKMISNTGQTSAIFLRALVLGSGLNNILPARIGEFAKIYYLKRVAGISFSRGMGIVFWERFSDLNGLLLLALLGALVSERTLALQVLAVGVLTVWAGLVVYMRCFGFWDGLLRKLPGQCIWQVVQRVLGHLRERVTPGFLLRLGGYTLIVLGMNFGITAMVLEWIGGLKLSLPALVAVFIISQLGLAIPSSPGSIGVYEAAVVLPLVGFGVDRGTALALAVVLHFIQYAPATIGCVYLLAHDNLSVREMRRQARVEDG